MSSNVQFALLPYVRIATSALHARSSYFVARVIGVVYISDSFHGYLIRYHCSQVHEIHPLHAFLDLPDQPVQSQSDSDLELELASTLVDENAEDGCRSFPSLSFHATDCVASALIHPDVKCAQ